MAGKSKIDAETFVRVYQTSASPIEAAMRLGISVSRVNQRSSLLRKRGVNLKRMPRRPGQRPLDVEHLNLVAQEAIEGGNK